MEKLIVHRGDNKPNISLIISKEDDEVHGKKKLKLSRTDNKSNIFLIISEENEEKPISIGKLRVEGKNYENSFCGYNSISDELEELMMSDEIAILEEKAKLEYFNLK